MYQVDIKNKKLTKLKKARFTDLGLKERYDIEEWIEKTPEILGEELLIISKQLILPSGKQLDLLAIDKNAKLVVIELKRDDSGSNVDWQAIKYTSYCSNFTPDEIFRYYAEYLKSNETDAKENIEDFIEEEIEELNENQRIMLVSKEFHSDVASAVLWLRDFEIDIVCIKLTPFIDDDGSLFITSDVIIPLPEAANYIQKKETKTKKSKRKVESSFSLEKSDLLIDELEEELLYTLQLNTRITPRLIAFLEIISEEQKSFDREEIKKKLFEKGIGNHIGQTGRLLSNVSQYLTKKSNPHLRQIIEFDSGGAGGEVKNNYSLLDEYRDLMKKVLTQINDQNTESYES